MKRIFAIGDIHGCTEAFHRMLFDEIKLTKDDTIYCIGDYIDRGPDSKGVADTIISLRESDFRIFTLRGNHEQMMMDSESSMMNYSLWIQNGGNATLQSFEANSYQFLPLQYRKFFEATHLYIEDESYIFVHAGLNFYETDIFEDKEAMLWVRDFNPRQDVLGDRILVHGHTPKPLSYILHQKGNCINIDGGCVYNKQKGYGHLIAISLPDKKFIVVENKR